MKRIHRAVFGNSVSILTEGNRYWMDWYNLRIMSGLFTQNLQEACRNWVNDDVFNGLKQYPFLYLKFNWWKFLTMNLHLKHLPSSSTHASIVYSKRWEVVKFRFCIAVLSTSAFASFFLLFSSYLMVIGIIYKNEWLVPQAKHLKFIFGEC